MKTKIIASLAAGILIGAMLTGPGTTATASDSVTAHISNQTVFVDGKQVNLTAYLINGSNYVKLRDIGKAADFNVYWDGAVRIESEKPYTGKAPATPAATPAPAPEPTPTSTPTSMTGFITDASQYQDVEAIRQEMIRLINKVRADNGVPALEVNEALMDAAQEVSATLYSAHRPRFENETIAKCGYPYGASCNLTRFNFGIKTDVAEVAVTNWVNSPGHFQTMIDPACVHIGVGVTLTTGCAYCYMFVGDPNSNNPYA